MVTYVYSSTKLVSLKLAENEAGQNEKRERNAYLCKVGAVNNATFTHFVIFEIYIIYF